MRHARVPQRPHQPRRHALEFLVLRLQEEGAQDAVRVARERRLVLDVEQLAARHERRVDRDAGLVVAMEHPLLDVQQHRGVHLRDHLRRAVVVLHQQLAGALAGGRLEARLLRDGVLHVEHEPVLAAPGDEVQARADLLHAAFREPDDVRLGRGQQSAARELGPVGAVAGRAGDPQHDVEVAQAAGTLLDVRLEAVRRLVVLRVALLLLEHLGPVVRLAVDGVDHRARKGLEVAPRAGDQPGLEHRRQHGHVARRLPRGIPRSVRTLWPGASPRSHSSPTRFSIVARSASLGACFSRIRTSTSEWGKSSPRP